MRNRADYSQEPMRASLAPEDEDWINQTIKNQENPWFTLEALRWLAYGSGVSETELSRFLREAAVTKSWARELLFAQWHDHRQRDEAPLEDLLLFADALMAPKPILTIGSPGSMHRNIRIVFVEFQCVFVDGMPPNDARAVVADQLQEYVHADIDDDLLPVERRAANMAAKAQRKVFDFLRLGEVPEGTGEPATHQ